MTLHPLSDERDTSIDRHVAATCGLCQRLEAGFTKTKNGTAISPICVHCHIHHWPELTCSGRFRCLECRQLLPKADEEWATLGIVRLAHGKRTRPHPTGICHECWSNSSRNTAREYVAVDDGQDPFRGLGR